MFAELEVLTDKTPKAFLAIPSSAVVVANGKQIVYIQNGDAFQPTEVTLGHVSGDMVEVKSGLFEEDLVVTQRAPQLYAQSLRGGSRGTEGNGGATPIQNLRSKSQNPPATSHSLPWWFGAVGGAQYAHPVQREFLLLG